MSYNDIQDLLRRRPFVPLRLHATDGRTYDVRHPDMVLLLRARVVLAVAGSDGIPDGTEHLALVHIVRAEEMPVSAAPGNGAA